MPYVNVNAAPKLKESEKEQLKAKMGELITLIPGKTEAVTMVSINDGCSLYLGGKALDKGAFIEIRLLGAAKTQEKQALTEAIFKAMKSMFGMQENEIYLNIIEFDSWGTGGKLKII
jgi:phenylpyruvate tautomerase PptA (4-oxalocrotonate tautomerase family)